jgi:eukaryotic-like serine/threonine-protein kinase
MAFLGTELNGKWRLLRLLGRGGTSSVFEAIHRNGRRAAVKLLISSARQNRAVARRLADDESRLANMVEHPGVVAILDNDVAEDGTPYLVMDLLDGEHLEDLRCHAGGQLPLAEALPIFDALLEVLTASHARGVVHRDIKPENVFVLRNGQVKLLDFGLAAEAADAREWSPWFGTPGFMPPEQAHGDWDEVDGLSDQWAAAATLFTILTGDLVHRGTTTEELVAASASEEVDLTAARERLPVEIVDVLERALAFDRADRFPSAQAFRSALRAARARATLRQPVLMPSARPQLGTDSVTRVFEINDGIPAPALPKAKSGQYPRFVHARAESGAETRELKPRPTLRSATGR